MAQKLYEVSVNGTKRLLPCNTPISLDIQGQNIRVVLHELSEPGTRRPAGFTATRHIELEPISQTHTVDDQFAQLTDELGRWVKIGYAGPEVIRDLLERGITLSDQAAARKELEGKEPSEDSIIAEANKLDFAAYKGNFQALYAEAKRLATSARKVGVDPKRLFSEFLGL